MSTTNKNNNAEAETFAPVCISIDNEKRNDWEREIRALLDDCTLEIEAAIKTANIPLNKEIVGDCLTLWKREVRTPDPTYKPQGWGKYLKRMIVSYQWEHTENIDAEFNKQLEAMLQQTPSILHEQLKTAVDARKELLLEQVLKVKNTYDHRRISAKLCNFFDISSDGHIIIDEKKFSAWLDDKCARYVRTPEGFKVYQTQKQIAEALTKFKSLLRNVETPVTRLFIETSDDIVRPITFDFDTYAKHPESTHTHN